MEVLHENLVYEIVFVVSILIIDRFEPNSNLYVQLYVGYSKCQKINAYETSPASSEWTKTTIVGASF